jgi:hypothetical protein
MCYEGGETLLMLGCFLDAFLGPFLPPVRPRLRPVRAAATVAKSSLSMPDSFFLEFVEADLLKQGPLISQTAGRRRRWWRWVTAWAKRRWSHRGRPRAAHPDPAAGRRVGKACDQGGRGGGRGSREPVTIHVYVYVYTGVRPIKQGLTGHRPTH